MATANDVRKIALALEGTTEAPHFDRFAFKVVRTYATLASDGKSLNIKLEAGEQELKCEMTPEAFKRVPNAWGDQGWTTVELKAIKVKELQAVLEMAWQHARFKRKRK